MFISKAHLIEVFGTKLALNLKSEVSKTYLSYVWWLLEPALMVTVLYIVFAMFLSKSRPDFIVFIMCGKIPFLWFSKSVSNSSNSITSGRGLINQVSMPVPFFPMLVVFQDAFKQSIVFLFMFVFFIIYGMEVSWVWLSIIFVIFTQFLLVCAISLLVSAITPFLPDFKYLIATAMLALMFGSGIFYSYKELLQPRYQELFLLNPVANLIKNYRQVFMDNAQPDWIALTSISLGSILLIAVMTLYFRRTNTVYARLIAQ
ncbi:MAG: ABC transporter permease [Proteobacteria bacterium]|nr:ABC transporter permease [Pseudomonadota bacterium]